MMSSNMAKDIKNAKGSPVYTNLDDFLSASLAKNDVIGSWGFGSNLNFTKMKKEETNVWFFEQVFNFLRSFFGLVMPDNLEIITYNASKQINRENLDQMTFLDELMLILKNLEQPIWVVRLNLSIVGFIRSGWTPDRPLRIRIQEPASFIVWGGADETGFQTFSISYKLFSSQVIESEGVALWSMNQPLLEKALRKWEKQSGKKIDVVKGNSNDLPLYSYGFSKPAPGDIRAKSAKKEEPPADDFIPDLNDLNI
ncbi:MAG: hypothetical protein HYY43_04215 [Deltaproteobacteria bacterium]|nr:hypothetical protein [Deltaproteobacteria bacterium]